MAAPSTSMNRTIVIVAAGLWAASAAAHPPRECRTALAGFAGHAEAFEDTRKVTQPALERLFAAWDEVVAADSHAGRHAVINRYFVVDFPRLRSLLSAEVEASANAMEWASKAIRCLKPEQ